MWDIQETYGDKALDRHLPYNGRYNREVKSVGLWKLILQRMET